MIVPKPVALIILDGFGLRDEECGNAVAQARKPNYDRYRERYPFATLLASGEAVGFPPGQMGNSEVGHLTLGAGRVVYQELTRISRSIEEGDFFRNDAFLGAIRHVQTSGTKLHLCGLVSDGGVHSHLGHLMALLELAAEHLEEVYIHAFLDGRDTPPDSASGFIEALHRKMADLGVGRIATVHGRYYAMDRDRRWERTAKAYDAMVHGKGRPARDPLAAIAASYRDGVQDEFVEPTVMLGADGAPVACVEDEDALLFFNFRPDRAIQLTSALMNEEFEAFDRGKDPPRRLRCVTMTSYNDGLQAVVAYPPRRLDNTLGAVLAAHGKSQLRLAETEKYLHVTYFFGGGKDEALSGETRILIDSPRVATYDLKPEMSAHEVAEAAVREVKGGRHDFILLNFANPDMVGHTGKLGPAIQAVEATDVCLGKVVDAVLAAGGIALITADHGNAEQMVDENGKPHTAHTTNPVPLIITDEHVCLRGGGVLSDIAPTVLELLQLPKPPEMTGLSLIRASGKTSPEET